MINLKAFREVALDKISAVKGEELEISSNITSPQQFDLIVESYAHSVLGAEFTEQEKDLYLRITKGYQAQYMNNVVKIGMTPEYLNKAGGTDGN